MVDILYRGILLAQSPTGQPQGSVPEGYDGNVGGVIGDGSNAQTLEPIHLLEKLYRLSYKLFNHLLNVLDFPHVTGRVAVSNTGKVIKTGLAAAKAQNYGSLWNVVKSYFDVMLVIAIPIATVFFIIGIYNSVINNPPEEQVKHFMMDTIRFAMVLVITANLFNALTSITEITEDITDKIIETGEPANNELYNYSYDDSPIKAAIDRRDSHPVNLKKLTQGHALVFFDSIFEYITLFLGGLLSILTFATSAFAIVMATIQRIVKPLMMLPFSTIVIGMSACSGEGERTFTHFIKNILNFCLSGVFIVMAIKIGAKIATMNLIHLGYNFRTNSAIAAIAGVVNMNLPVVITTGLVKASDGFMGKIFS